MGPQISGRKPRPLTSVAWASKEREGEAGEEDVLLQWENGGASTERSEGPAEPGRPVLASSEDPTRKEGVPVTRNGICPDIPSTGNKDCPVSTGSGEGELHPDFNREDRALSRGEYPRRWQEGWSASQRPGLLWSLLAGHQGSQASGDLAHRQRDRGRPARWLRSGEQFSGKTALRKTALQEIHVQALFSKCTEKGRSGA